MCKIVSVISPMLLVGPSEPTASANCNTCPALTATHRTAARQNWVNPSVRLLGFAPPSHSSRLERLPSGGNLTLCPQNVHNFGLDLVTHTWRAITLRSTCTELTFRSNGTRRYYAAVRHLGMGYYRDITQSISSGFDVSLWPYGVTERGLHWCR